MLNPNFSWTLPCCGKSVTLRVGPSKRSSTFCRPRLAASSKGLAWNRASRVRASSSNDRRIANASHTPVTFGTQDGWTMMWHRMQYIIVGFPNS
jgi:hypothetical protein